MLLLTCCPQAKSDNIFDNLPDLTTPSQPAQDELTAYLAEPCAKPKHDNALLWWIEKRDVYPRLSRMALDYLSMPGKHGLTPLRYYFYKLMMPP